MKSEQTEELLKRALSREIPDQMRERILNSVAEEPRRSRSYCRLIPKLAFAALLIAAILVTGICKISDSRRYARLQSLVASPSDTRVAEALTGIVHR